MSDSTFNTLSTANYNAAGGFNSATKTIDVAIEIETTSGTVTPLVSGIVFNVTSTQFEEISNDSICRVRYIEYNKTEFTNVTASNKTFNIFITL